MGWVWYTFLADLYSDLYVSSLIVIRAPYTVHSIGYSTWQIFCTIGIENVQCKCTVPFVQCTCTVYVYSVQWNWDRPLALNIHSNFLPERERYLNLFSISKKYFSKPEPFPVWLISILVDAMGCLRQFLFEYSVPSVCSLCA